MPTTNLGSTLTRRARDWMVVTAVTLVAGAASFRYDLVDQIFDETRRVEHWEVDELAIPIVVLIAMCLWYTYRRFTDLQAEIITQAPASALPRMRGDGPPTLAESAAQGSNPTRYVSDWIVVAIVTLFAGIASYRYDLVDQFYDWTRVVEDWEIDEVIIPILVFAVLGVWLAYRRISDWRSALAAYAQTTAALRTQENQYRTLVESSIQGMAMRRGDGTILLVNSTLADIFGYRDRQVLEGQDFWQLVDPSERVRLQGYARARLQGRAAPSAYEWKGRRQDGTRLWLDCRETLTVLDDDPVIMTTVVDISEQKRQEQMQQKIAYNLHDDIAQLMVSAQHHLNEADDLWEDDAAKARHHHQRGSELLNQAIDETRRLLAQLRPAALESLGLISSIRQYVEELREEEAWEVEFLDETGDLSLTSDQEDHLFHIIQEALTNARKHAKTAKVTVALKRSTTPDDTLLVTVQDWGVGFEPAQVHPNAQHLGPLTMQERAKILEGICLINSQPGQGTTVSLRLVL
ncbi:PAS domain-containing sensor histidine kinase [Candidatus Entotheonella palauensis]|uniref:PAS domain-containing sensor histidine kinase n=1 Tax=Candidatus Entotheonella palauensis TaxID=93172 RepID=UPI000B7D3A3D|nr:PAS domain S-box protein [Candidatus Entotheonella palauensis]